MATILRQTIRESPPSIARWRSPSHARGPAGTNDPLPEIECPPSAIMSPARKTVAR
jgi:hypothetical protein